MTSTVVIYNNHRIQENREMCEVMRNTDTQADKNKPLKGVVYWFSVRFGRKERLGSIKRVRENIILTPALKVQCEDFHVL